MNKVVGSYSVVYKQSHCKDVYLYSSCSQLSSISTQQSLFSYSSWTEIVDIYIFREKKTFYASTNKYENIILFGFVCRLLKFGSIEFDQWSKMIQMFSIYLVWIAINFARAWWFLSMFCTQFL